MRIRPVEERDRAAWLRLRSALWPDDEAAHEREIDRFFAGSLREPDAVLVAEQGGRLVGMAEVSIRAYAEGCATDQVGYLEGWYVEPAVRKRGVGRALLRAGEGWARSQGCTEFASDAELDNEASARAHFACGFEETGRIRYFKKSL